MFAPTAQRVEKKGIPVSDRRNPARNRQCPIGKLFACIVVLCACTLKCVAGAPLDAPGAALGALPHAPVDWAALLSSASGRTHPVSTEAAFNKRASELAPGDVLVVRDGEYGGWSLRLETSGTADRPIIVTAETPGGVTFAGTASLRVRADHLIVGGFVFKQLTKDLAVKFEQASHNRFSGNKFYDCGSPKSRSMRIVGIADGSNSNRFDHNEMWRSITFGMQVRLPRDNETSFAYSQHNRFDHNVFRDTGTKAIPLQIGQFAPYHNRDASHTIVDHNEFINISSQAVNSKSNNEIYFRNRFIGNKGGGQAPLSLRAGNDKYVDGNYFEDVAVGIHIYGERHTIVNNTIVNARSIGIMIPCWGPYQVRPAQKKLNGSPSTGNIVVAYNTIVNAARLGVECGRVWGYQDRKGWVVATNRPFKVTFCNNILSGSAGQLFIDKGSVELDVRNNLYHAAGTATPGVVGANPIVADPLLVDTFRVEAGSPAVDAADPSCRVERDAPGRPRDGRPDIGAHEVATAPTPAQIYRNELEWRTVNGVRIPIPANEHPRLYLRKRDLADLPRRMKAPDLQPCFEAIRRHTKGRRHFQLELDALAYLVNRDRALGRKVLTEMLEFLQNYKHWKRMSYASKRAARPLVSAAIAYDWCYDLLTPDEKDAYIQQILRLAAMEECGYPPHGKNLISGHPAEAMIMRDMLSAAIAIYDEHPDMYETIATLFFGRMLKPRNWIFRGRAQPQGASYGPGRFGWDAYPLWIFARMGAGTIYDENIRYVPYTWIYARRPDGSRMRGGDTFGHFSKWGKPWPARSGAMFIASYYGDDYIQHDFLRKPSMLLGGELFRILWHNFNLQPKPPDDLPLTLYCPEPIGWMLARSGWDENSAIVEMKINEHGFGGHQHFDAGAFQIYYRGGLALDSGDYHGTSGRYHSKHCRNYYRRTIAHNSLLIHDPDEHFRDFWGRNKNKDGTPFNENDGGQQYVNGGKSPQSLKDLLADKHRTGRIMAHAFGPDPHRPAYSHLKGDIAPAYSDKVRQVVRSFVYLNMDDEKAPAALIVFDRVVSSNPAFRKYWLLHTEEEPTVEGNTVTADRTDHEQRGRLVLTALAPAPGNRIIEKIGGPGKEFWSFGKNWKNDILPHQKGGCQERGNWRIQISPRTPAEEDVYLNVMQMLDRKGGRARRVVRIGGEADGRKDSLTGCRLGNRVVMFNTTSSRTTKSASFRLQSPGTHRILVTDLEAGTWKVLNARTGRSRTVAVSAPGYAAHFEGEAGEYHLTR